MTDTKKFEGYNVHLNRTPSNFFDGSNEYNEGDKFDEDTHFGVDRCKQKAINETLKQCRAKFERLNADADEALEQGKDPNDAYTSGVGRYQQAKINGVAKAFEMLDGK